MSITITIEAQSAAELAELVQDLAGTVGQLPAEETTKQKPAKETKPPKTEEPEEEEASSVDETEDVPEITDEELRAEARKVGTSPEAKAAIKELLAKYNVKNLTAVPKGDRPQFLEELKEIGK